MKFLEGLLEHDAVPFDVVCASHSTMTAVQAFPEQPLYGIGLRSRNKEGEILIERITCGHIDMNLLASPLDAATFAGDAIFPMDFGPVHKDLPITIVFSRGEAYEQAPESQGGLLASVSTSGVSFSLRDLDACLKRLRPPSLRLTFIGSRMSMVGLESFGDLRWCREEILRLREANQRMWDREYVRAQVEALQKQQERQFGSAAAAAIRPDWNGCYPGPGVAPGYPPTPPPHTFSQTSGPSDEDAGDPDTD